MPRLGMEPIRRGALIRAAIGAIHEQGSLDVTVGRIAERAGVSAGLAHHYFGGKDQLIVAAMRHLLAELAEETRRGLRGGADGRARLSAIVAASFGPAQFEPETVSAWLVFYARAQSSPEARRLLRLYFRRLNSNLTDALARLAPPAAAREIAEGAGALIDGLYLRRALAETPADRRSAIAVVEAYLDARLAETRR